MDEGLSSHDTAHRVTDEDSPNTRIYSRRRGTRRDFEVDDDVLKPAPNINISMVAWGTVVVWGFA